MENRSYDDVIGSAQAPYENALARSCGLAANYHGITHPSLPNYLAATGGSTFGVADDAAPQAHQVPAASLFGQLASRGWASYEESMPRNCSLAPAGLYAVKHNPAAYYLPLRAACRQSDLPLGPVSGGPLARGLDTDTLPAFTFVTPNLCHDVHSCPIPDGDGWLRRWVTHLVESPAYQSGSTLVVITFDEADRGNRVPTIVVAPSTAPGTVSQQRFDHYSLLATTESLLGLPALGAAVSAASMRPAFNL